jgi:hypothetical protein
MRWRGDHFKPIQAEFSLTAELACDYTKRPEVMVPNASPSDAEEPVPPRCEETTGASSRVALIVGLMDASGWHC